MLLQSLQSWKSAKGVGLLATLAFAVGLGSTTAIYTVVNTVMLAPLPYPDGDRFGVVYSGRESEPNQVGAHSADDLVEYERRTTSFDVFGWFRQHQYNLTAPGPPQHVLVTAVTPSLAHHVGVQPRAGQWFHDDSGAVISHRLWSRLGSDPALVGQGITLNGRRYTVTGVMAPTFLLPVPGPGTLSATDIWIALDPYGGTDRGGGWFIGYARQKPGVSAEQAAAEVRTIAAEIARLNPATHPSYTAFYRNLRATSFAEIRPTLLLLFGAAAMLLLITCANVAGLLLTRSIARARETATRVALGASQRQLAFQYFLEGLLPAIVGSAIGVLVSVGLVRVMLGIAGDFIPRADQIVLDARVLMFGAVTAIAASVLSSVAPLWQAMRTPPNEVLSAGVRASASARIRGLSRGLVIAEIALAFTLIAVSAILVSHLRGLSQTAPGFDPRDLLTFDVTMDEAIAAKEEVRTAYQSRLIAAIQGVPGVQGAAFANQSPLDGCCLSTVIYPEGRPPNLDAIERVAFVIASPGFIPTLRIPLRAGRLLSDSDTNEKLVNAVISEATAARYWPGVNPLEARGRLGDPKEGPLFRVVGVVGDIRNNGLGQPPVPEIYLPSVISNVNPMGFVVRSALARDQLVPEIRRAIQSVDASVPMDEVTTMDETIRESLVLERASSFVTTFFALAALLMASLGVYGVVSYGVRQRRVEIGTRMALGAVDRDVVSLVLGHGLKMAGLGIAAGSVAVIAAATLLVRFLNVTDLGWLPFASSAVLVALVASTASSLPAWRATRLSPMVAIRDESPSVWHSARRNVREALAQMIDSSRDRDAYVASEATLLTEFVAGARAAASSRDVLRAALIALTRELRSEWALLLEPEKRQPSGDTSRGATGIDVYTTTLATDEYTATVPAHGYLLSRLRSYSSPLALHAQDLAALLGWAREHKAERVAEIETLQRVNARLAVALRTRREILGVIVLGPPAGRDDYTAVDKRVLRSAADHVALMIENARLTDRVVEQEKLRRDVALAAEVQQRLLPEELPVLAGATLAAMSLPARTVGGDYYDFIDVGANRVGIALADVAGKGVAAALIMAAVQASLRVIASEDGISLPQLAAKMNRFLYQSTSSARYATFFYAQLDQQTRELRYVNAGHNPPYLVRKIDGHGKPPLLEELSTIEELSTGGTVIGLLPETGYEEATVTLRAGDVLVAYTDGVPEAQNPHEEEFGEERLKRVIREVAHLPVEIIASRIADELRLWISDAAQYDDLTFVVLKVD